MFIGWTSQNRLPSGLDFHVFHEQDAASGSCILEIRTGLGNPADPRIFNMPAAPAGKVWVVEHQEASLFSLDPCVLIEPVQAGIKTGEVFPAPGQFPIRTCTCSDITLTPCPPLTVADCSGGIIACVPVIGLPGPRKHSGSKTKGKNRKQP